MTTIETTPELSQRRAEFERATNDLEGLVRDLSEEQLLWKPAPERWSIAECVDHLNTTGELYVPRLEAAIEKAPARTGPAQPTRHGWFGNFFINAVRPGARRLKAPKIFRPRPEPPRDDLMPRFRSVQKRFLAVLDAAQGRDISRIRVSSPALALIRFRVGTWLQVMTLHEARHIEQARSVTEEPGFPS